MLSHLRSWGDRLRSSLFFIPMLCVIGGVLLGEAMLVVDALVTRHRPSPHRHGGQRPHGAHHRRRCDAHLRRYRLLGQPAADLAGVEPVLAARGARHVPRPVQQAGDGPGHRDVHVLPGRAARRSVGSWRRRRRGHRPERLDPARGGTRDRLDPLDRRLHQPCGPLDGRLEDPAPRHRGGAGPGQHGLAGARRRTRRRRRRDDDHRACRTAPRGALLPVRLGAERGLRPAPVRAAPGTRVRLETFAGQYAIQNTPICHIFPATARHGRDR